MPKSGPVLGRMSKVFISIFKLVFLESYLQISMIFPKLICPTTTDDEITYKSQLCLLIILSLFQLMNANEIDAQICVFLTLEQQK
jgi:hypothetical protein